MIGASNEDFLVGAESHILHLDFIAERIWITGEGTDYFVFLKVFVTHKDGIFELVARLAVFGFTDNCFIVERKTFRRLEFSRALKLVGLVDAGLAGYLATYKEVAELILIRGKVLLRAIDFVGSNVGEGRTRIERNKSGCLVLGVHNDVVLGFRIVKLLDRYPPVIVIVAGVATSAVGKVFHAVVPIFIAIELWEVSDMSKGHVVVECLARGGIRAYETEVEGRPPTVVDAGGIGSVFSVVFFLAGVGVNP